MPTQVLDEHWLHAYATLALRVDRHLTAAGGTCLIYDGPDAWRAEVAAEAVVPPARLVEECEALRRDVPVDGHRGAFLAAQLTAMRATAPARRRRRPVQGASTAVPRRADRPGAGGPALRRWLDHPDRHARVRRLLTEPMLPADLV
jgi:hypothetical protein